MVHWISDIVIKRDIRVALCLSETAYHAVCDTVGLRVKWRDHWLCNGGGAVLHKLFDTAGDRVAVVCLDETSANDNADIVGYMAHEGMHIVQWQMECMGETKPSDELQAYSIQSVITELVREFTRQKWA